MSAIEDEEKGKRSFPESAGEPQEKNSVVVCERCGNAQDGRDGYRSVDRQGRRIGRFLSQNAGRLSNRARENEFAALTDEETEVIEAIYSETFGQGR